MNFETGAFLYNGKKNVLWGAGEKGIDTLFSLAVMGVPVELFCDSDKEKQDNVLYDKLVVSPEFIFKEPQKYNMILAVEKMQYMQEIADSLLKHQIKDYITWQDLGAGTVLPNINRKYIKSILQDSKQKKMIIYGNAKDPAIQAIKQLLDTMGVKIAYLIDDVEQEYEWMNGTIKPVYDLLYEKKDTFKVIVTSDKAQNIGSLNDMGLVINKDYGIYGKYVKNIPRSYILDVHLGYNFCSQKRENPGFIEVGEKDGHRIVLLGGSTTDGALYSFKSWGEILYEKFKQNGYKVRIINGGCGGYSSSQELLKLIRDVIPMRPEIVIDYTGVNDLLRGVSKHSFVNLYQKELFESISEHARFENAIGPLNMQDAKYTLGVEYDRPVWMQFADNIRMMRSICKEFDIKYYAFLQPHLTTKRGKYSDSEKRIIEQEKRISEKYIDGMDAFYNYVKQHMENYIEDISTLFDEDDHVYFDRCHVVEEGNEKIAQYMYDYLIKKEAVNLQR